MIAVSPAYHEFTKYDPETIATLSRQLDWSQQPSPFKTYPIGHLLPLKPHLTSPAVNPDSGERFLQRLSRLLHLSYGVTAIVPGDRPLFLRSVPSAGGLYPAELYVLSRGRAGLPAGIYNYQALDHALLKYWDECDWSTLSDACFLHPLLATAEVAIVVTAVFQRSAWRYEDRAYRRLCLDTGHLLGNIELSANMTGFRAASLGEFQDGPIERLLSLDEQQEGTLAVLPLQDLLASPSINRYLLERDDANFDRSFEELSSPPVRGEWLSYLHLHTRIAATETATQRTWTECLSLPET